MAKISGNKIESINEDWGEDKRNGLPYSGSAVQSFIKSTFNAKVGASYFEPATMTLLGFRNAEERNEYITSGNPDLVIDSCPITINGVQNRIVVTNRAGANTMYFTTANDTAYVQLGLESQEKSITDTEWKTKEEDFYVSTHIDKGASGSYELVEADRLVMSGSDFRIDIRNILSTGNNRLKITVKGASTDEVTTVIYTVVLTTMYLKASNFAWYTPYVEGTQYNLGGMNIGGAIPKKLKVVITGLSGTANASYERSYEVDLGTSTYINTDYFFQGLEFPSAGTGVYNVNIWLDASGLESDHLRYNIMCVAEADSSTAQLVTVCNEASKVNNYADNKLFDYALYNGGRVDASPHIEVATIINTNKSVIVDQTLNNVPTVSEQSFSTSLEVETEEVNVKLTTTITFGNQQIVVYAFDNSASYPAVAGAALYFNSSLRNNGQDNREAMIDIPSGREYSAVWERMSWVDGIDGWTLDSVGRKALLLPARSKCTVTDWKPMASVGTGKTIEINFMVTNASDRSEPIISIADDPLSPTFSGIVIYPNLIVVHSRDLDSADMVQSYNLEEEKRTNIIVTIVRNYKTNYGNICQIYCNGDKACEFEFQTSDNWVNNGCLTMGSSTADLSVYSVRMYDQSFGWHDVVRNYINSLPTTDEKKSVSAVIDAVINDSYNVDYDLVAGKFNTFTVEMLNEAELPHYGLSKEYSAKCNFILNILKEDSDKPTISGTYNNTDISGQGTTSMNYWLWNLRWKKLPIRLTAKKNYASSMQSHKIGATRAFNDLHHELGLDNEAGAFVAVYQYPCHGFQKIKIDGTNQYTYKFIGLFTIGPDKGDKGTFGWTQSNIKPHIISLEGTDHNIKGVGYDYPYERMKYVLDKEALCVDKGSGNYDAAFEVAASGSAESEADIQTLLDEEFKPAYNVVYNNSTMIYGTSLTLDEINADVDGFGLTKDECGNALQRYEIWTDGVYDLYYLDKETNTYKPNGVNLLTDSGLTADSLSSMTIAQKNEMFRNARRTRFKANMEQYWHLNDNLFTLVFFMIFGLTDNFKKNMYPYKMLPLADGGRWRQRQDDTDTLADIDNQGLASKGYSIEFADWTDDSKSAYVFKGEDSVFWTLLRECYPTEIRSMGKRVLSAMYSLSDTGTNTVDKLMGFFQKYFWNNAQDYFTKSAYNVDAEYAYEDAWYNYRTGKYNVDVHPLAQSKGRHYEAERAWFRQRLIYCMSMYGYGCFSPDGYNDTSLGRVTFRTQLAQPLTLTPAMDLYPTALSGQSAAHTSARRVRQGESVTLSGVGGTNTNVYIMASDMLEDLGDLSSLSVDSSSNATLAIASKNLKSLKVGDEVAGNVTSNVEKLDITSCPSLERVDARNLASLNGTVDLSQCPRLSEALFAGTNAKQITLPSGSKIEKLQLPESLTVLDLQNLKFLVEAGLEMAGTANIQFVRIEGCPGLNPFSILRSIYNSEGQQLRDIRITGFTSDGDAADCTMLANLANDLDKNGADHPYNGIDSEGAPVESLLPVVQGTLNVAGNIFEDDYNSLLSKFPNLELNIGGALYIRFADSTVNTICAANWGDGVGISREQAAAVTSLGNKFRGNTTIVTFDEFERFIGVTALTTGNTNSPGSFNGCTNLTSIKFPHSIKSLQNGSFTNCKNLKIDVFIPNLESIGDGAFLNTPIKRVLNLGNITNIPGGSNITATGAFNGCTSLIEFVCPETVTSIGQNAFRGCKSLSSFNIPTALTKLAGEAFYNCTSLVIEDLSLPNLTSLGQNAFYGVKIKKISNLGSITSLPASSQSTQNFGKKDVLEEVVISPNITSIPSDSFRGYTALSSISMPSVTTIGSNAFNGCTSLVAVTLPASLTTIAGSAFSGCTSLEIGDLSLPNLETLASRAFIGVKITKISNLGKITAINPDNQDAANIGDKSVLKGVTLPNTIKTIGNSTFSGYSVLETITIESGASGVSVGSYAFLGLKALTNFNVDPACFVSLGIGSFKDFKLFSEITFQNVTAVARQAFRGSTISKIKLPSVETMEASSNYEGIFSFCPNLVLVDLGENCSSIGNESFGRGVGTSGNNITIICRASTPPTLGGAFFGYTVVNAAIEGIYVPDESIEAYKTATNWSAYANKILPLSQYKG